MRVSALLAKSPTPLATVTVLPGCAHYSLALGSMPKRDRMRVRVVSIEPHCGGRFAP